jgi:hypothetical protein
MRSTPEVKMHMRQAQLKKVTDVLIRRRSCSGPEEFLRGIAALQTYDEMLSVSTGPTE